MKKVVDFPDRHKIEKQAADWLIRLDGDDTLTSEELTELRQWLALSPTHREELRILAELWSDMNVLTELAVPLDQQGPAKQRNRWLRPAPLAAAAAAVVVAIILGWSSLVGNLSVVDSNGLYATAVGQQRLIELADGSTVLLNTDSQIRVNYGAEFRDVHLLRGEARFSVYRDTAMPFRVAAGAGRIRALGTSFSVYLQDGAVEVTVIEGSVALESTSSANAKPEPRTPLRTPTSATSVRQLGTLRAGQIATISSLIDKESGQTEVLQDFGSIDPPELSRRLAWTEGVLIFSGEPLAEVVREISRYTVADIEFSNPEVAAIRIGGRFPVGETETMFETLESTFGLSVTYLSEDHVLVSARD